MAWFLTGAHGPSQPAGPPISASTLKFHNCLQESAMAVLKLVYATGTYKYII
jgi:hypothetical protein